MNREQAEKWLSAMMDGELSPHRQQQLELALTQDPSLADLRATWENIAELLRTDLPETSKPEVAWQDVQRGIRLGEEHTVQPPLFGYRAWVTGLTLVLVLVAGFFVMPREAATLAAAGPTEVEWVESELPGAMSMVYQDEESGWTVIWVDVSEEEVTDEPDEANHRAVRKA